MISVNAMVMLAVVSATPSGWVVERMVQPAGGSLKPPSANPSAKYVEIDGRKNPERIPDHWLWRSGFLRFAEMKRLGETDLLSGVAPLSDADAAIVMKEAVLQSGRDEECARRLTASARELTERKEPRAVVLRAYHEITIECRTSDLDAADRVLDALSPEGRTAIAAWLEDRRHRIVAQVPEEDVENFKLPR